jgi:hypothetical protein
MGSPYNWFRLKGYLILWLWADEVLLMSFFPLCGGKDVDEIGGGKKNRGRLCGEMTRKMDLNV